VKKAQGINYAASKLVVGIDSRRKIPLRVAASDLRIAENSFVWRQTLSSPRHYVNSLGELVDFSRMTKRLELVFLS